MRPTAPVSAFRRAAIVALVLLAVVIASHAPASLAAPEGTAVTGFQLSGRYVLVLAGQAVPEAKLYFSSGTGSYYIEAEKLPTPILVYPRNGCVEAVTAAEKQTREDGTIDLRMRQMPCKYGRFRLVGADVVFRLGDVEARLTPKPALLGGHYAATLLQHTPEYGRTARTYRPNATAMQTLKASTVKARVTVYFGSWCGTCSRLVPRVMRVEEELKKAGSQVTFDYFGLRAPPHFQNEPQVRANRITKLPAVFVFVNGRSVGRFASTQVNVPEVELARYIR